jgi:hypothetical protein
MIRFVYIVLGIFAVSTQLYGQRDSILAVNVFQHRINENGQRTADKSILYQETYTDGLLRQILYYDSLANIDHYTFHFYNNDQLISSESYNKTYEIDSIRRYTYGSDSSKIKEVLYLFNGSSIEIAGTWQYTLLNETPFLQTVLNEKGKWIARFDYSYPGDRFEIVSTYKKNTRPDLLKTTKEVRYPDYFRPDSIRKEMVYYSKLKEIVIEKIVYDQEKNKPKEIITYTESGEVSKKQELRYDSDGSIVGIGILDPEGKYIEYLSFRAKRHLINFGEREMYVIPEDQ